MLPEQQSEWFLTDQLTVAALNLTNPTDESNKSDEEDGF